MFGLIVRTGILLAIVFGVVYAATRALRKNAHGREAERIRAEIRKLRAGIEQGLFTQAEYARLARQLEADCTREGIEVPALPERLPDAEGERESAPGARDRSTDRES